MYAHKDIAVTNGRAPFHIRPQTGLPKSPFGNGVCETVHVSPFVGTVPNPVNESRALSPSPLVCTIAKLICGFGLTARETTSRTGLIYGPSGHCDLGQYCTPCGS